MKPGKEYLLDKIGGNKPDKYDEKTLELIAYWMDEYAKYYHEQQVNSVDLADVGGNEVDSEESVCYHPPEHVTEYEGWGKERMLHCNKCGNSW
jgi:hypothetical protein